MQSTLKRLSKIFVCLALLFVFVGLVSNKAMAASIPYEVTKSDGSLVRTYPSEDGATVRRAPKGSIVWVKVENYKTPKNTYWHQLTDGNWIYSKNVTKHSCTWTLTGQMTPSCVFPGAKNYQCNKCGATKTTSVSSLGHNYSNYVCTRCNTWNTFSLKSTSSINDVKYCVVTTNAIVRSGPYQGCSGKSIAKGTDIIVTQRVVNAHGSVWYKYSGGYIFEDHVKPHNSCSWNSGQITKQPTCTATGTKLQTCSICAKTRTVSIAKVSHTYESNVCKVCGGWNTYSLKSETSVNSIKYCVVTTNAIVRSGPYQGCSGKSIAKGTDIIVTQRVVNAHGSVWYKCAEGYIFEDHVKRHNSCDWNSGKITKQPTCTATGSKTQTCTICGKTKTTALAKLGHAYTKNVCTRCKAWNTSSLLLKITVNNVKYCVVTSNAVVRTGPYEGCKSMSIAKGTDITVTQKVINAHGHVWYKYSGGYIFEDHVKQHNSCDWNSGKVTKQPTCTAIGTKVQTCSICGKTRSLSIAKVKHTYESNVCKVCGGWNTSSLKSKTTINKVKYCVVTSNAVVRTGPYAGCKGKSIARGTDIVVTQKVVNASGSVWYKCAEGYIFKDHVKGHAVCSWSSGKITKQATCTAPGEKTYTCKVCLKKRVEGTPKVKHAYEKNVCKTCGGWNTSSLKSTTTINKVKYCIVTTNAKVRTGPYEDCSSKSIAKGTVIVVTQKVVNANGNTWYKYSGGYIFADHVKSHKVCTWNSGKITKQATCTATGVKTYTCTLCNAKRTETIAKKNHSYTATVYQPTCTAKGYTLFKCSCGKSYTSEEKDALGHSYTGGKCTRCNDAPTGVKITTQPKTTYAKVGSYAQVQVKATGDGLTYTWYVKDTGDTKYYKSSQNTNTYKVKISADTTGRKACCIVKDQYGNSVKTQVVELRAKLSITQQPKSVAVTKGATAKVTVKASGAGLTYRWYYKDAGASDYTRSTSFTGNTYQITMNDARNGRMVLCRVYDKYGKMVQTNSVKLSLKQTVKITKQPTTAYATLGSYAQIQVQATGDGLTYTWYVSDPSDVQYYKSSQNTNTYKVKITSVTNGRSAYCVIKDKYGNIVKTQTAELREKLTITQQPKSVTVAKGATAKVTVKASGTDLTYRWYYKNPGSSKFVYTPTFTGNTYQIKMGETRNGRQVLCRVYDQYDNMVQTKVVTLSMK